jgi:ribosome-associated toxin RatA of RatAB toxin-antitoxin module
MPSVRKSAIVPASCESMFALVVDVERYPEFLPWCAATEVYERTARTTRARLDVDYRGLKTSIATRNAKDPPESITLELEEGPFQRFSGAWRFEALGDEGCRVELTLDYAFSGKALETLLGAAFGLIAETMVESFVRRAESLA